jgi:DNA-binding NarL/FixJ family response regulator
VTRVLVADDQALVRGGIVLLLGAPDVEIVGEAVDGRSAIDQARSLRPDVVVMDLRMPGIDGVEATRQLTEEPSSPGTDHLVKVLVLTTFSDDESVYAALRSGASGYLVKDQAPRDLLTAVREIAAGGSWIDPAVAGRVIAALRGLPTAATDAPRLASRLSAREREVLVQVAYGRSNAEISAHFTISDATVRTHVSRILMKTGSRDRSQAVALAYQSGLVRLSPSR